MPTESGAEFSDYHTGNEIEDDDLIEFRFLIELGTECIKEINKADIYWKEKKINGEKNVDEKLFPDLKLFKYNELAGMSVLLQTIFNINDIEEDENEQI